VDDIPNKKKTMKNINKRLIYLAMTLLVVAIVSVLFAIGYKNKEVSETISENTVATTTEKSLNDKIIVDLPRPNQKVQSPIHLSGRARGTWFFEASFPILIVDEKGNTISQGQAQAKGDWMTTDFVPFEANLEYSLGTTTGVSTLILKKDNPSGDPEKDESIQVPIILQ
jgi:hypothetical protein